MERVTGELCAEWSKDHEVTVFSAEQASPADTPGFRAVHVPGSHRRTSVAWTRAMAAATDWSRFDVIVGVSAAARQIARLSDRPPVVMQAHGTARDEVLSKMRSLSLRSLAGLPRNLLWLIRDSLDIHHYDQVVAVGPGVARSLSKWPIRLSGADIRVIPNGVKLPRPTNVVDADFDLVYVGRLHREKGVDLAVRAVRGSGLRMLVIGDGPQRRRLEALAEDDENIIFSGALSGEVLAANRCRAKAAIMPSRRREGLPLSALEALAGQQRVFASPGVVQAFGTDIPAGVIGIPLSATRMRESLRQLIGMPDAPVALPRQYELEESSREYVALFREVIE